MKTNFNFKLYYHFERIYIAKLMTNYTEKNTAEEDSDIIEFLNRKLANLTVNSDATEVLGSNDGLPVCEVSALVCVL